MYLKDINYNSAKELILRRLKRDSAFHQEGQFDKMGEPYDDFDEKFPRPFVDLMIAWTFWDAWIDERNHGFPGFYQGITRDSWPKLAGHIINQLEKKQPITDPLVLAHFDFTEKPNWLERLKKFFKQKNGRIFKSA